ncbi:MAG TPA: Hsp20/alpha crystallin family protein [Pirellulales bacterium]|nr:Hsp20/alpha crystallin family protein [Pirellulales bacterium]
MSRVQSNGAHPMTQLRGEVDRLFTDFFGGGAGDTGRHVAGCGFPALNVWERGEELYVEAELPGLKVDDVDISVVGGELVIQGKRMDLEEQNAVYHRRERGVGEFYRALRLPIEVNVNKIEAKLADGVLLITLPKAEAAKPRRIQVKTA